MAFTGDAICQLVVEKAPQLDVQRALRFGLVVTCVTASLLLNFMGYFREFIFQVVLAKFLLG